MSKMLIQLTISQSELFSSWFAEDVAELVEVADLITIDAGACLAHAGECTDYLYLLASGSVRLTRPMPSGLDIGGKPLLPGDFHGLEQLITQQSFIFTATCREKCILVRIPGGFIIKMVSKSGRLFFPLFSASYRQYVMLLDCYASAALYSVRARVAAMLTSIGVRTRPRSSLPYVCLSQDEIASMLGTRRQVINRALKSLEMEGAIVSKYGRILLVDIQKLEKLSRDEDVHP
ncbi:Crp/Fnr family transcriptional regulator [Burkholderia oklahomensis]|uniref:Crp/Fnr family transcriptional regulator n=1 Tax=Burkholderia oklahomensis TaxID=342113 RepID=UPI0026558A2D|nr:Crp/Fnr family transcriptional regulator [Burkholderia oklahomensis]MDN7676440.1 Crp/Fnr family transcriptional regulator [Burkholderia oklahomensis]